MSKLLIEATLLRNYGWKRYDKFGEDKDCSICLDTMKDTCVLETECGHVYHPDCIIMAIMEYRARECLEIDCSEKYEYMAKES